MLQNNLEEVEGGSQYLSKTDNPADQWELFCPKGAFSNILTPYIFRYWHQIIVTLQLLSSNVY